MFGWSVKIHAPRSVRERPTGRPWFSNLPGDMKMRSISLQWVRTLLLVSVFYATPGLADDGEQIAALYADWRSAVESGNIPGYVDLLHPDISLRPPGVAGLDGRANYREFLGPVFDSARYEITIDTPPASPCLATQPLSNTTTPSCVTPSLTLMRNWNRAHWSLPKPPPTTLIL